jgi:hypothetical protein
MVWASQNITFRIICPEMKCPTFLFTVKGLRTNNKDLVKTCIHETWDDEMMTQFIYNRVTTIEELECEKALKSIQLFKNSMWIELLATKAKAACRDPLSMCMRMMTSSMTPMHS